jgi:murein DD-endopeptidase MepM/ murein hydrolase activator NlpD
MLFNALNTFVVNKVVKNNQFLLWAIIALGSTALAITVSKRDMLEGKVKLTEGTPPNWPFEPLPFIPEPNKKFVPVNPVIKTIQVEVGSGENLSLIFQKVGLPDIDLLNILSINKDSEKLKNLKPGQKIKFEVSDDLLQKLVVQITNLESLIFSRQDQSFTMEREVIKPDTIVVITGTELETSLYIDGKNIGLSDSVIMQLTAIFAWDIDFSQNIRIGDRFKIIYEKLEVKGEYYKTGRILAAEFINQATRYTAFLNIDDNGKNSYFSEKGHALQKTFLRNPVDSVRVSSRFNLKRKHPILNRIRAHRGVDYAAPIGTPIRATADGQVEYLGVKGGYGNTIELQHGGKYTTLYAHLSDYAKKLKIRSKVAQGQVIGYVGKSGLATGPHLHYEFRVNGEHRDPLTVKLPAERSISLKYKTAFEERTRMLLSLLNHSDTHDTRETKKITETIIRLYSKR